MKATAVAYAIQGLIKYHGLKDPKRRIPYHDSISVCAKALETRTTVESDPGLDRDEIRIDGVPADQRTVERAGTVLDELRRLGKTRRLVKVESKNSIAGKGLGFSASGYAALGLAAASAMGSSIDQKSLSAIVRLGSGSATRSLSGGFSRWYANKGGRSYAEQICDGHELDMRMVIVPIPSSVKTETAHEEIVFSPFFKARLQHAKKALVAMERAISKKRIDEIGRLAEMDTLNLHAATMTGPAGLMLIAPESLNVMHAVMKARDGGLPAWFSMDTGPSVFINTYSEYVEVISKRVQDSTGLRCYVSEVGGAAKLVGDHLF